MVIASDGTALTKMLENSSLLVGIFGSILGIFGTIFGIAGFFWNRRESRLTALSSIIEPMVKSAQHLARANNCRRRCEQLRASFPDPASAPEAAKEIKEYIERYNRSVSASEEEFRLAEAGFGSRSFRFPDRICELIRRTLGSLSEGGRLVNGGGSTRRMYSLPGSWMIISRLYE